VIEINNMAASKILIIGTSSHNVTPSNHVPPEHSITITLIELREWVNRGIILKHIFRYKEVQLLIYRLGIVTKPLLTAVLIRLLSRGVCYIKDKDGHCQNITISVLIKLLWKMFREFRQKPQLLRRIKCSVEQILREHSLNRVKGINLDLSKTPFYLRTDLWFGIHSGGSVGHTAGVLNNLDKFTGKPIFLTTDTIPTVRNDIETHIVIPENSYWDFMEIPSLIFNENFIQRAQRFLSHKKISFIYQRYSINNYSGVKLAGLYKVPFILEYNGSEIWINRHWGKPLKYESLSERIEMLSLHAADLLVVVSKPMKDDLIKRGIEADKILVNPNGVDPEWYSPHVDGSAIRKKYNLNRKTVIGFISTFDKWHGAEALAEAFGLLLQRFPIHRDNVRLLMIGDGLTMPEVKKNLSKLGVADVSILTGLVPQEEAPEYLAACDILVSPHVPNPDGTPFFGSPTKLFEYMAMGKGIVASDLDQIGEVLKHSETAWMVKPGDVESLMQGMKRLIDDEQLRKRLGEAARKEAVAKYTWRGHTRRIIEALQNRVISLEY
jgi:glycosyltransferase involved in cell wall biosynthesis